MQEINKERVLNPKLKENATTNIKRVTLVDFNKIPIHVQSKINKNLHLQINHPISVTKNFIYEFFKKHKIFSNGLVIEEKMDPFVSVEENFDSLCILANHPLRSPNNTFYLSDNMVLRTQITTHLLNQFLKDKKKAILSCGEVFRKSKIDKTHSPVFYQLEATFIIDESYNIYLKEEEIKKLNDQEKTILILRMLVGEIMESLFPRQDYIIESAPFYLFINPTYEVNIKYTNKYSKVLNCGILHSEILAKHNISQHGIIFSVVLDRLAMILFGIPDIRFLWVEQKKFICQFKEGVITQFEPHFRLESVTRDISFWVSNLNITIQEDGKYFWNKQNDFTILICEICGILIEKVEVSSIFYHPSKGCFYTFLLTFSSLQHMKDSVFLNFIDRIRSNLFTKKGYS